MAKLRCPSRGCIGELIQIDGSEHRWVEDRGPACTLLVYVDDATSRLMQLLFVSSESTFTYFEATRGYLELYGKPLALYIDDATSRLMQLNWNSSRQIACVLP